MKKQTFLITVVLTNVIFILILLHKRNAVNEELYTKQRYEEELHNLTKLEDTLRHEISGLQDRHTVKTYAQTYLRMAPINLTQIKKITS
jgi:cell division protein FtsB